jgi:phosphatidylglycerophosphatase A
MKRQLARWCSLALATGGFLSYLPAFIFRKRPLTGAGLIGSGWAVVALPWLPLDPTRQAAVWLGVLAISVVVSETAEDGLRRHDDPRIVIDEFIGYWTAVLFLPRSFMVLAAAFILFRIFDVLKPGWVRRAARLPAGWGIVMDDVLAGVCANGLVRFAHALNWI